MLKSLALLSSFFISFQVSASCDINPNLLNKSCSAEYFKPKNQKQLNEYLQDGKFKNGKLLNLELDFDIRNKEINVATWCDIKINKGVSIKSSLNGICIKGANVFFKGDNQLYSDKKAPIVIGADRSITLRRSILQTNGFITLATKNFNPFDGEILISKDSILKADKVNVSTPSNLIINKDSSLRSPEVVLNGGNCEIGVNDDREHDDDRDHDRSCKRFSPKFQYSGKCASNPLPVNMKITSSLNATDSLTASYGLEGRPLNTGVRWRFDQEAINIVATINKSFIFPGRHLIESIVVDKNGYFKKMGIYQNLSPSKLNKGQTAIFQFIGLKRSPSKVTALMGLRKFTLTRFEQGSQLYSGEIPAESAGEKLIAIPAFGYKGSFNLVALPAINNPDEYIGQSVDQLSTLLDSINTTNQSYINSKISLQSLLGELKIKIYSLPASDKQKIAEYLQANFFADLQGITSFKQIKERPTTLFGLLIASAYADNDINDIMLGIVTSLNNLANTVLRNTPLAIGGALIFGGYIGTKYLPIKYRWIGYVGMAAGTIALVRMASAAQDTITDVHNIDPKSLLLRLPNQINSDEVAIFNVWGKAVPLDSITPVSPLISQSIDAKNNVNFQLEKINSSLSSANSTLSLLGFSSQIEPLPPLSFPQTTFSTVLSTNYITNVQLISSEDGQASIQKYSKNGNNLQVTFKSSKTQSAKLRVTFVNSDFGINKNIDTDIVITVAPKAIISYTKNNLAVSFDSTDLQNPNATGLTYSWNFGDSQTSTEKSPNHTYSQAGTYPVLLTVTDAYGAEASSRIDVSVISNNTASVTYCNISSSRGTMYFLVNESEEFYLSRTNDACECHTFQVLRGQYSSIYGYFELDSYPGYIESMDYEESIFGEDNIQYYRGGFGYIALYIFKVPPASLDFYKNSCAAIIYK